MNPWRRNATCEKRGDEVGESKQRTRDPAFELESLRRLLHRAPVILYAFDAQGRFTLSEGTGLHALGLGEGGAIGRSLFDMYCGNQAIVDGARRVLAGEAVSMTAEVDGGWYTSDCVPVRDASGRVIGGTGFAIDVSDRIAAADVLNTLDVIVWVADAESMAMSFVSDRAVPLLGFPADQWVGQRDFWADHLHPDERAVTLNLWRQVAADGVDRSCVHRVTAADGRPHWFRTTLRAVRHRHGPVRSIVGTMLEVTERISSQSALGPSEARFRMIVEQLPAMVYTIDRDLRFTSGAGGGLAKLGLSADQTLPGVSIYEYFQTRDPRSPLIEAHVRAVAGESVDYEADWIGRTYQTHLDPFRDAHGEIIGAIGIALDVTERRRVEAERDRLLAQEQAARAAAEQAVRVRDEFLSVASHELFTPLTALQLSLQRYERAKRGQGQQPNHLVATAQRQVRRLSKLVGDLLNVSRIQSGRMELSLEELDLAALAREVVARFAPELEQTHTPLVVQGQRPVYGRWDRSRLDQVVTNLVSNALKYAAGKPVDLIVERAGSLARLRVRDRGIGISPELLPRIFGRFERGVPSHSYAGMGLGLFIVRSLVEAHGGNVRVESTLGAGSTFTVELPLEAAPRQAPQNAKPPRSDR